MPTRRRSGGTNVPGPATAAARDLDLTGVGALEAADQAQHRRLAAAAGAEQRADRSRLDLQVDAVDGAHRPVGLAHAGAAQRDVALGGRAGRGAIGRRIGERHGWWRVVSRYRGGAEIKSNTSDGIAPRS